MKPFPALAFCLAWLLAGLSPAPAQEKGEGPASLVISYRSDPENRTAFRTYMERIGTSRFEQWKRDRVFSGYELYFTAFAGNSADMTAILHFTHFADLAGWSAIERGAPGGLSPEGLRLARPVSSDLADLLWHGASPARDSGQADRAVYLLIPYEILADPPVYKAYVQEYVVPQMDAWIAKGAMTGYGIYLNEAPASAPWGSLLVLEYRGYEGLSQRAVLKARIRQELAANPAWKKWSETKTGIRTELRTVLSDPLFPR